MNRFLSFKIFGVLVIMLICVGLFFVSERVDIQTDHSAPDTTNNEAFLSPLYLSIVMHTEEDMGSCIHPKARIPDYDGDEDLLLHFTNVTRAFGKMAQSHGAKISFGSDWTFSHGVELYDPTFYIDMEAMGHEIDAHAHQSCYDYEQVRADIVSAGGSASSVASGLDEDNIYDDINFFNELYPEFRILWGVASPGHDEGEPTAGWVWRPSRDDWTQHDPEGKYIYIGNGELVNSIESIRDAIQNRRENAINTYSVFLSPRELEAEVGAEGIDSAWTVEPEDCTYWETKLEWWNDFLSEIDEYVKSGEVQYASLEEVAGIFEQNEDTLIFDQQDIPRSTTSMPAKNKASGYCF